MNKFNLKKYNIYLILLSDLCIKNRNVILNKYLINIKLNSKSDNEIIYEFDITNVEHKYIRYILDLAKKEKNIIFYNTTITNNKLILNLVFQIPKNKILKFNLRIKYGFEFLSLIELENLLLFWNGYCDQVIQIKKAAARESSRLYFLLFHYLFFKIPSLCFRTI